MMTQSTNSAEFVLEEPLAPKRSRLQEFWRLFRKNRLAVMGLVFFVVFFLTALIGLILTSGSRPMIWAVTCSPA